MTVHSFHRLFDRIGTVAGRLPGARRRNLARTRAEIARYPTIVHIDLGWPPLIDDGPHAKHIMKFDGMN